MIDSQFLRDAADVRAALLAAGHTPAAEGAQGVGPAMARALACRDLLEHGLPLPVEEVAPWLPIAAAARLGLVAASQGTVRPLLRVAAVARLDGQPAWVVSDLRPDGPLPVDHVMGAAGASRSLATLVPREPVDRALDLGCGSGVQSLLLAGHASRTTASDPNPRALRCTALTTALSGYPVPELVAGSLAEPFADASFDLVVSNPPFVIGPDPRRTYRDSPFPADGLTAALLPDAARVVRAGGLVVVLTSWLEVAGQAWEDRVRAWLPAGCSAWVARREAVPPEEYVGLWLADANDPPSARGPWLGHLRSLEAEHVCFGWIVLRRERGVSTEVWCEDVASAPRLPDGQEVLGELGRRTTLPTAPEILAGRPVVVPGARAEAFLPGDAAAAGLAPATATEAAAVPGAVDRAVPRMMVRDAGWRGAEPLAPALSWWFAEPSPPGPMIDHLEPCCEETAVDGDEVLVSWLSGVRDLIGKGFATLGVGDKHLDVRDQPGGE